MSSVLPQPVPEEVGDGAVSEAPAEGAASYQWPGTSAWVALFCAMAALLTLGGYIRIHRMAVENARQSAAAIQALEQQLRSLSDKWDARWVELENRGAAEAAIPLQDVMVQFFAEAEAQAVLSPMPAKAELLPLPGSTGGLEALAEITELNWPSKRVMIDRGRRDGLSEGLRLAVYRGDEVIGEVVVTVVFDEMAACQVETSKRDFARGDWLRLTPLKSQAAGVSLD